MSVRKIFLGLVSVALCFGLVSPLVFAADTSTQSADIKIMPPYPGDGGNYNPFFGQEHAYSVTFRGNGQAVIFLRVAFSNNGNTPLKELTLRFPKIEPEGVLAYQIIRAKQCLKYDYSKQSPIGEYACLEFGEPNYSDYYYGANTYKKAKSSLSADTLKIELLDEVATQKSGSVLIYFRTFGYTKKNTFGAYDYNFETLKVDDTIRNLRVGISPDSDLHMKGATGNVDYFRDSAPVFESGKMMSAGVSFTNSSVDSAIQNIGYGTVNKNASNLMPLDSYKVKGTYADSSIKLYAGAIIFVVALSLLLLVGLVFAVRKIYGSVVNKPKTYESPVQKAPATGVNLAISAVAGFGSASLISISALLAYFFIKLISSLTYNQSALFLSLFIMLVVLGVTIILLFVPGIFMGVKRGVLWGLATFGFTLFWLFVALVIVSLIFVGLGQTPRPIELLPYKM